MKTRGKKHNLYYYIDKELSIYADIEADMSIIKMSFVIDNHSLTEEEAELIARKLRAVLNGADVIETPSENLSTEEIKQHWFRRYLPEILSLDDLNAFVYGFKTGVFWLKTKIVK